MDLPDYINPDDDDEVEQYKQQMAKLAAARKVEAHKKYFAALSDIARIDLLAGDVHRIVTDINAGYSPFILNEVALFVLDPELLCPGGVVLVGFRDGHNVTEEAILLNKACSDPNGIPMSMSDELGALMSTFHTPSLAVPALVDSSPATKDLPPERKAHLVKFWSHWFSGEKDWSRFHMSGSHRPSLGSWTGMPWEPMYYCKTAMRRGIGDGVQTAVEAETYRRFRGRQKHLALPLEPLWVLKAGTDATAPPSLAEIRAHLVQSRDRARVGNYAQPTPRHEDSDDEDEEEDEDEDEDEGGAKCANCTVHGAEYPCPSGCGRAVYCDSTCAKEHWKGHRCPNAAEATGAAGGAPTASLPPTNKAKAGDMPSTRTSKPARAKHSTEVEAGAGVAESAPDEAEADAADAGTASQGETAAEGGRGEQDSPGDGASSAAAVPEPGDGEQSMGCQVM